MGLTDSTNLNTFVLILHDIEQGCAHSGRKWLGVALTQIK